MNLSPANSPASRNAIDLLESTRSVLRRSARRAFLIGQFAAAVKWQGEALELDCTIAAMREQKAGAQ